MFVLIMILTQLLAVIMAVGGFVHITSKTQSSESKGIAYILLSIFVILNMISVALLVRH